MGLKASIAAIISPLVVSTVYAGSLPVYFGTYTSGNNGSKGIYRSKLDTKTGKLSSPVLAADRTVH